MGTGHSDNKIEWRDMFSPHKNSILNDGEIEGQNSDGSPITVNDILEFSKNPKLKSLTFDIKGDEYRKKFSWVKEGRRQFVTVFKPEDGQQIQVLNTVGAALYFLDLNKEATEAFQKAINIDPNYTYAYNGLGVTLCKLGRYEEAVEVYKKAISIDPKYVSAYYNLGVALTNLRRYEESIELYQKAIKIDPKDANIYHSLGAAIYELKRYKEAIKEYQKAIKIDPKKATIYNSLGAALYELKRYKEAIKAFQKAIKIDPKFLLTYDNLGDILSDLGRNKKAIEAYKIFVNQAVEKEEYDSYAKETEKKIAELENKEKSVKKRFYDPLFHR